jgi:hypothetical protein
MTGGCINPEWRQGPAHVQSLPAVVFWIVVMSLAQPVEKQLLLPRVLPSEKHCAMETPHE